ncbi:MAG: hypothetical protein M3R54_05475 [Chloroflexota bacterium]|nr:hypothetical protein [Chloroflexota bacterium]
MDEKRHIELELRLEDRLRLDLGRLPVRPYLDYRKRDTQKGGGWMTRGISLVRVTATVAVVLLIALAASFYLREQRSPTPATSPTPPTAASASPSPAAAATTPAATVAPTATPAQTGTITGRFGYGSDYIPPVTVYAISTTDQRVWYSVVFAGAGNPPRPTLPPGVNNATYTISGVAPGTYWIVAYRTDGLTPDPGYYSRQVECFSAKPSGPCPDVALAPATVTAGQTTSGIDVTSWGPPNQPSPTFPPRPTPRP